MIRQISKVLIAVEEQVSSSKREARRRKKMVEFLDWRPEAIAKSKRRSKQGRWYR